MKRERLIATAVACSLASLVVTATAGPAYAVTNTPYTGAFVTGPNCEGGSHFWWSSSILPIVTGGDYTGHEVYNMKETDLCNDTSEYVWTDPGGVDTTWVWVEGTGVGDLSVAGLDCYVWVYIPSENAGAPSARYDIWATNDYGLSEVNPPAGWHWLFWPGHNIDQQTTTGWVFLGQHPVGNYTNIAVTLTNRDTAGWEIGAGSVAFDCVS
ncbi:MAG TPA: hypothetical protein VGS19_03570 [Streptosporangiaceae bacterium]|nr:hypothetical protein [Streptosporangiaceae bacterium]